MKLSSKLTFLITFTLAAVVVSGEFPNHKVVLKSLQEVEFECKQYLRIPPDAEGDCEPRCEQILLRAWTDCHGFRSIPFGRHFHPDQVDEDFLNRTQLCLDTALEDVLEEEVCCQSSLAWQCYRDQYGNPRHLPQLAPMPDILVRSTVEDCARLLQINDLELTLYALTRFDVNERSHRLLRCIVIRQGLYGDVEGPHLDRMFVQGGGHEIDENSFKENARECVEYLRRECHDNSTLATRIVNYCFPPETGPGTIALVNTAFPVVSSLIGSVDDLVRTLRNLDPLLKPLVPILAGPQYALNPEIHKNPLGLQVDPLSP